jgi:hypothetical protein
MQYTSSTSSSYDKGWLRYAGWNQTSENPNYRVLFSEENMLAYQKEITRLLTGVGPNNRPIIVPLDTIGNVLYQCYETNTPRVGDIYSRYIQSENSLQRNDIETIQKRAINIIVTQIRNEYGMAENNQKLTIWSTLYGDFNDQGLRSHPPIKLRNKHPQYMQFHLKY